jgi:murein DD-endopeptidase MepM/ murein hydrolase activator NlpD
MFEQIVVGGARLTQGYGCTSWACAYHTEWNCPARCRCSYGFHAGIDFAAPSNSVMLARGYGRVVAIGRLGGSCGGLGPFAVGIQSGGVVIWYGHAARNLVGVGQQVIPDQPIALMGFLGCVFPAGAGGTHCHFEVLPVGKSSGCDSVDPGPYLSSWPGQPPAAPPSPIPPPPGAPPITPERRAAPWILAAGGLLALAASSRDIRGAA